MQIRDRIKSLRRVKASDLLPNPKNWRTHPQPQVDALRGVLAEVGWADATLARETPNGLMLIDGHLRAELAPDENIPVLVLDVSESEADLILATHDPLAAMANTNAEALNTLLGDVHSSGKGLASLLDELAQSDDSEVEIKPVDIAKPPKMTWVLIGIPTVEFGSISPMLEDLADGPAIVEIVNDEK